MDNSLKACFARHFRYDWKLGIFLIFLFGIPRFIIVLQSYVTGNMIPVMLVFLCMWFIPFVLLTKQGRRDMGLGYPSRWWKLPLSFLAGVVVCLFVFGLFWLLFGHGAGNAFVYIGGNNSASMVSDPDRMIYFLIAVIPSMLFSPIGEEFLYRGVIHGVFVTGSGETKASVFDALAFALTHVAHFGIVYLAGAWHFLTLPATIWVVSMFLTSLLFFWCKCYCNSIWGAVASHAGFNFMMMYGIFFLL